MVPIEVANRSTLWKTAAITGACLTGIGITAGYVDVATHFRFEFISDQFSIFLIALLVGVLVASVGLIGLAKGLKRQTRRRLAGLVFISPWILGVLGYPIDGLNIHGPSVLVLLLIIPASIVALVLTIMAENASA